MAAPSVASSASNSGASSSLSVTRPTGVTDGDLLIAVHASDWGSFSGNALPSGFTALTTSDYDGGSNNGHTQIGYRIASSEPASYSFAQDSADSVVAVLRITGADSTPTIAQVAPNTTNDGETAPSITPNSTDDLLITVNVRESFGGAGTWTAASGMTTVIDRNSSGQWAHTLICSLQNPSSPSGDKVASWSGGSPASTWGGVSISIAAATGSEPNEGTASGTVTWAGTAVGAKDPEGSASGTVTFAGTATGERHPAGSASGSVSWAGTAVGEAPGIPPNEGTAAGSISWAGSATGERAPVGSATGSVSFAGTAAGVRAPVGSASGSVTWVGVAEGSSPSTGGSASGTITWEGVATGQMDPLGTASGTILWTGVATGTGADPTFIFEPPTFRQRLHSDFPKPLGYFSMISSTTVFRSGGGWAEQRSPSAELLRSVGDEGVDWFRGGHVYEVSFATAQELQAAGYTVTPA